jgi:hypothetical protein
MLPPILPINTKGPIFYRIIVIPLFLCATHIHHSKHTLFTLKSSVYISNYLNVTRPRLEVEGEGPQLHCPLGDAPGGIPIVEDIRQWEVSDHQDVVRVEIMAKLSRGDEYTVK